VEGKKSEGSKIERRLSLHKRRLHFLVAEVEVVLVWCVVMMFLVGLLVSDLPYDVHLSS
jgi:hypothetical protein